MLMFPFLSFLNFQTGTAFDNLAPGSACPSDILSVEHMNSRVPFVAVFRHSTASLVWFWYLR